LEVVQTPLELLELGHSAQSFSFYNRQQLKVVIPLRYLSLTGRHLYDGQSYVQTKLNHYSRLDFLDLIDELSSAYLKEINISQNETKDIFIARVLESTRQIGDVLSKQEKALREFYQGEHFSFIESEQALVIGHTFHPYPKSREGLELSEQLKYSPEYKGSFKLHWFLVSPKVLTYQNSAYRDIDWATQIFDNDKASNQYPTTHIPFPVHPWQKQFLLKNESIKRYLKAGLVLDLGEQALAQDWQATTSLRCIYQKNSDFMLKFSLSARLTNSIRHLQEVEVVRGIQALDVFSSKIGQQLTSHNPTLHLIGEPGFMAINDETGKIISESIVVARDNPFKENQSVLPLATLTQEHPFIGDSLIARFIKQHAERTQTTLGESATLWFSVFIDIAISPLLSIQSQFGIYLGAHQQNLVIEVDDNRLPIKTYFRDCQGTGYEQTAYNDFLKSCPSLDQKNGNILPKEIGNTLFSYYVIINSVFGVIASIGGAKLLSEEKLILIFRKKLEELQAQGLRDDSCIVRLLNHDRLATKGNFGCCLKNFNENTLANPVGIYVPMINPLVALDSEARG
jgi:N2-citryl-N6-acetyl-N6-hydroxylysine synthase